MSIPWMLLLLTIACGVLANIITPIVKDFLSNAVRQYRIWTLGQLERGLRNHRRWLSDADSLRRFLWGRLMLVLASGFATTIILVGESGGGHTLVYYGAFCALGVGFGKFVETLCVLKSLQNGQMCENSYAIEMIKLQSKLWGFDKRRFPR